MLHIKPNLSSNGGVILFMQEAILSVDFWKIILLFLMLKLSYWNFGTWSKSHNSWSAGLIISMKIWLTIIYVKWQKKLQYYFQTYVNIFLMIDLNVAVIYTNTRSFCVLYHLN